MPRAGRSPLRPPGEDKTRQALRGDAAYLPRDPRDPGAGSFRSGGRNRPGKEEADAVVGDSLASGLQALLNRQDPESALEHLVSAVGEAARRGEDPGGWGYVLNFVTREGHRRGRCTQIDEALATWMSSLEGRWGKEHPVLKPLLWTASQHCLLHGSYDEAEANLRRAVAITEKVQGLEHPELPGELEGLARLLHSRAGQEKGEARQVRLEQARELRLRALALAEQLRLDLDRRLVELAALHADMDLDDQAAGFFRRACDLCRAGRRRVDRLALFGHLQSFARFQVERGRYREALQLLDEALREGESILPGPERMARLLKDMAQLCLLTGDEERSRHLRRRAAELEG